MKEFWKSALQYFEAYDQDDHLMMEQSMRNVEFWRDMWRLSEYRHGMDRQ